MRRLVLPVAMAALLALGALVLVDALRPGTAPTQAEEALQVAAQLRCPDCQALSVAESQTDAAAAIRRQIVQLLADGQTPDQVRQHFVDRYGEWILLAPSTAIAWWPPVVALVIGVVLLGLWLARGQRTAVGQVAPADEGLADHVRDELEQLDA